MTDTATSAPELTFAVTKNLAAKSPAQRDEILQNPGFGTSFTDHMVDICWSEKGGWHRPRVQPYGPISLDPAAAVLHYGQEIFEGIKAYRHADGSGVVVMAVGPALDTHAKAIGEFLASAHEPVAADH